MNRLFAAAALTAALFLPSATLAASYSTTVGGIAYQIWIPDDVNTIYGVWVRLPESSGDTRGNLDRAQYQSFARSQSFGIIGIDGSSAPGGQYAPTPEQLQDALDNFASQSGHPELVNAVYLLEGLSFGGFAVKQLNDQAANRVLCSISGASFARAVAENPSNPAFNKVPTLYFNGDQDSNLTDANTYVDAVQTLRSNNGSQVAGWIYWGLGHARGDSLALAFHYWDACTKLRYPDNWDPRDGLPPLVEIPDDYGWLADRSTFSTGFTDIVEAQSFSGNANTRFWLATRGVAFAYRGFSSQDPAVRFSQPNSATAFELVDPGQQISFAVTVDGSFGATEVTFYDGAAEIGTDTSAPFAVTWTAEGVGAHNIVAVARNGSSSATGLPLPVIVEGIGQPGGGGLDNGERPDAGAGNGGGSGGDDGGGSNNDNGGCACRSGDAGSSDTHSSESDLREASAGSGGCDASRGPAPGIFTGLLLLWVAFRWRGHRATSSNCDTNAS